MSYLLVEVIVSSLSFHRLEKLGDIDRAMRCYREALADSPEEETARTRLGILTAAAEKKVCVSVCVHGGQLFGWLRIRI